MDHVTEQTLMDELMDAPATAGELAIAMCMPPSTVGLMLRRLEERGLVSCIGSTNNHTRQAKLYAMARTKKVA